MKTLLIDDDLYAYLVSHTKEIGESASTILRRLLGLSGSAPAEATSDELGSTFTFLNEWGSYRHLTQTKKFLHILSWAYKQNQAEFEKVLLVEGSRRKYFATDARTLSDSGSSTNPRPIPNSPYWVVTNNSTMKKQEILSEVFRLLGYDSNLIQAMLARI